MPWLFILFVLVPALELYILIQIGTVIGAWNTFLLILATGLLGSWLAKSQGLATWRAINERFAQGQIPGKELMDGAIILVCAALLLTPGVLTDAIGLAGLVPWTRSLLRTMIASYATSHSATRVHFGSGAAFGGHWSTSNPGKHEHQEKETRSVHGTVVTGTAKTRPGHDESP